MYSLSINRVNNVFNNKSVKKCLDGMFCINNVFNNKSVWEIPRKLASDHAIVRVFILSVLYVAHCFHTQLSFP